jgi:hypothetical protein
MFAQLAGLGLQAGGMLYGMGQSNAAADRAAAAAREAAGLQVEGLNNALNQRSAGLDLTLGRIDSMLSPFSSQGMGANRMLSDALGLNGDAPQRSYFQNFQNDPGYRETLKGGTDAIEQSAAGGGMLRSGGTLKALQDYGARLQSSVFSDRLNRLAGLGAQGQQAATTQAMGGATMQNAASSDIAGYLRDIGAAKGGGVIGASNADQRGTQNMLSMLGYGMGQMKAPMNDLFGSFAKGGGGPGMPMDLTKMGWG